MITADVNTHKVPEQHLWFNFTNQVRERPCRKKKQTYSFIVAERRWQQGAEKEKKSRSEGLQCCTQETNGLFLHFAKEKSQDIDE